MMEGLEQHLLDGLHKLPPDDQITFNKWADRWEEWVRQYGMDPLTFDFDAAITGVVSFDSVLGEVFGPHPMIESAGEQIAVTLVLMKQRQKEAT